MRQVFVNQYEKIDSGDVDNLQIAIQKAFYDDFLYNLYGNPAVGGVVGSASFACTYTGALAASLALGAGFFYDSTQTGYNPNFRMILASAAIVVAFQAANTQDRIDVVSLAPNFIVKDTANRYVKTGGTGPITLTTVNKDYIDSYTLTVTKGTPGVSPVAPSVPAGNIPIAQGYIHANTGLTGQADITDTRVQLVDASIAATTGAAKVGASASGHTIATGATVQLQLDEIDTQLTANGPGDFSGGIQSVSTSTLLTSASNSKLVECNTSGGAFTLTLPASPATNFKIHVKDVAGTFGTNQLTINPNGKNIEGISGNMIVYANFWDRALVYDGTQYALC